MAISLIILPTLVLCVVFFQRHYLLERQIKQLDYQLGEAMLVDNGGLAVWCHVVSIGEKMDYYYGVWGKRFNALSERVC